MADKLFAPRLSIPGLGLGQGAVQDRFFGKDDLLGFAPLLHIGLAGLVMYLFAMIRRQAKVDHLGLVVVQGYIHILGAGQFFRLFVDQFHNRVPLQANTGSQGTPNLV